MSTASTLIVTATPNPEHMTDVQEYLQGVMPLFVKAGGTLIKRVKVSKTIHGRSSGVVLVMDFPSETAIEELFASNEYQALIAIRDRGFAETNILITSAL